MQAPFLGAQGLGYREFTERTTLSTSFSFCGDIIIISYPNIVDKRVNLKIAEKADHRRWGRKQATRNTPDWGGNLWFDELLTLAWERRGALMHARGDLEGWTKLVWGNLSRGLRLSLNQSAQPKPSEHRFIGAR